MGEFNASRLVGRLKLLGKYRLLHNRNPHPSPSPPKKKKRSRILDSSPTARVIMHSRNAYTVQGGQRLTEV